MGRWTNWADLARGVLSLLGGRTVFSTTPHPGVSLVFDRPVPIEIDGEPMRADRVKIQAAQPPTFAAGSPRTRCFLGVRWIPHAFDSFIGDGTGLG